MDKARKKNMKRIIALVCVIAVVGLLAAMPLIAALGALQSLLRVCGRFYHGQTFA